MVEKNGLKVERVLHDFLVGDALPGSGIDEATFYKGLAELVAEFAGRNRELLAVRDDLQTRIDAWHDANRAKAFDQAAYLGFLKDVGYLRPQPTPRAIQTANVDEEIADIAGPQLVVPINNARYALNAANARWGSLYDALYGTDAILEDRGAEKRDSYNPVRGARVVAEGKAVLDLAAPLLAGSHASATHYRVESRKLVVSLIGGAETTLRNPGQLDGYRGTPSDPSLILLSNNGLHLEIVIDRRSPIGRTDAAGVADIMVESALSTIMDMEDSVAAVDAADKVVCYRNWLGLMKANLRESFQKNGETLHRVLNGDRTYRSAKGGELKLPGRSLMLIRSSAHHVFTDAVKDAEGRDIPENLLDAMVIATIARHDLYGEQALHNTRSGSVYIVKPKMHGPDEVAFANEMFGRVEELLDLPRYTLKMGIMDEERRTSANLTACVLAADHRVFFINTGFLDRTGDEIHTSMEAGSGGAQERDEDHALDRRLRGYERRRRIGLRPAGPRPDRKGHVGGARPDGADALDEAHPPRAGRQHRLGALADGGDAARAALPRGRRCGTTGQAAQPQAGRADRPADDPPGAVELRPARGGPGAGEQRAGAARLRRALDRPGRRLLQGARHQQHRPDGGPCDAAHLLAAHRQLAAPRHLLGGGGAGRAEAHGRRGR